MKKGKEVFHPSLYNLLDHLVNDCNVHESGTYNRQDPTHYERGEMLFEYKGTKYSFYYYDCTWGVEVTISYVKKNKEIASFYLDWDARKYNEKTERWVRTNSVRPRQNGKGWVIILLARAFRHTLQPFYKSKKELAYEEEMEMWLDPAGGVHYGNEGDPAKMYE